MSRETDDEMVKKILRMAIDQAVRDNCVMTVTEKQSEDFWYGKSMKAEETGKKGGEE